MHCTVEFIRKNRQDRLRDRMFERPLERVAGIEPAYSAWKAAALPLSYTRIHDPPAVVEGVGFEPT
jgi:hypothetical protein